MSRSLRALAMPEIASNSLTSFSHAGWGNSIAVCQGIVQLFGFAAGEIIGHWLGEPRPIWACVFRKVCPAVRDYDSTVRASAMRFSLYHFVNLMVGYVVGRRGYFNMEKLKGNLLVCAPR